MPKHIRITVYGSGQVKHLMPHLIAGVQETFLAGLFHSSVIHMTSGQTHRVRERKVEIEREAE